MLRPQAVRTISVKVMGAAVQGRMVPRSAPSAQENGG